MRNQESEIGFLGATAGLPSSALFHLFERALVSVIRGLLVDVIASTAKQSPAQSIWGLLRRFTPRNDTLDEKICPVKLKPYPLPKRFLTNLSYSDIHICRLEEMVDW